MSTNDERCPICGLVACGGILYPYMLAQYEAGRNRDHWLRVHSRESTRDGPRPGDAGPAGDAALRDYGARHGGCCG